MTKSQKLLNSELISTIKQDSIWAPLAKHFDTISMLIKSGADVNAQDTDGNSPLLLACQNQNNNNLKLVKLLIASGADVNKQNKQGKTALLVADQLNIIKLLLENGANIHHEDSIKDKTGQCPPLIDAVLATEYYPSSQNIKLIKLLLDYGANPNLQWKNSGETALHIAAFYGLTNVAKLLIKQGADLDIQQYNGDTPLMVAIQAKQADIVKLLLNNYAQVVIKNNDGFTALDLAQSGELDEQMAKIIKLLESYSMKLKKRTLAQVVTN